MKEQGKNPPDQTKEEEIGSLLEKEFRVMIGKMIQNLGNRMEKIQETFNKDLEEQKSKQTIMNNTINEIKNSVCLKGKNLQPRLLYPARISFIFDGEVKTFRDKQKLREFSTIKPALQQMLKELL